MKQSLQNIVDIIINPTAVFTRLKSEPKWVIAFTVYCLLSVLLAWTLLPYTQQLLAVRAVETPSYSKTRAVISLTVISMAYTILMAIVLSVLLTITARIAKVARAISFKHIYAVFCHIMLVRLITFSVNAALLPVFRDVEEIQTTVDARVIPGLHLLAGFLENEHLLMFLSYITPVAVWYVFVLTIGINIFADVSKVKALCVAFLIWLFRVSLDTTFVAVFLR